MPLGSAMETTPSPGVGWPQGGRLPVGDQHQGGLPPNIQMLLEMLMNRPPAATPNPPSQPGVTGVPSTSVGLDTIGRAGYR